MFMGRPNHLDSPEFEAYLYVLERVIVDLRKAVRSGKTVDEDQIHDLLDAVHNIPTMLAEHHGWYTPEHVMPDLERYDHKWHGKPGVSLDLSLVAMHRDGLVMANKQQNEYRSTRIERPAGR